MSTTIPEVSNKSNGSKRTDRSSVVKAARKADGSKTASASKATSSRTRASNGTRAKKEPAATANGNGTARRTPAQKAKSLKSDSGVAKSILRCHSCNEVVQLNWKRCPFCESSLLEVETMKEISEPADEVTSSNGAESPATKEELPAAITAPISPALEDSPSSWAKFRRLPLVTQIALWGVGFPFVFTVFLQNRSPGRKPVAVILAVILSLIYYPILIAIGNAGDGQETETVSSPSSTGSRPNVVAPPPVLPNTKLEIQAAWSVVDADAVELTGNSQPGATLKAEWNGATQDLSVAEDGSFKFTVGSLPEGDTRVVLTGVASGHQTTIARVVITRQVSEQKYKASATSIPYDQLNKDPAALAGRLVTFKAKVFQYDSRTTTSHMMAEVTPGSYGFWDDIVFLNLDPRIAADVDEDDVIQFWGSVKGAYTYDTAIGGSNTLPDIDVKYLKLIEKLDE
jgi:hypothetical protein